MNMAPPLFARSTLYMPFNRALPEVVLTPVFCKVAQEMESRQVFPSRFRRFDPVHLNRELGSGGVHLMMRRVHLTN